MDIDFTRYFKYGEIVDILRGLESEYPELMKVLSAGKSLEGRDIWYAEITNTRTGPAADKPAYQINGNHHAGEVTGSSVALYTIWYLVSRFGRDREVTDLLDTRAFYILPRIAVDGSELYLTTPYMIRSSVRLYPDPEVEKKEGLYPDDVDGDGRILQMRVPDPNGEWKVSALDRRLMVRRAPDENGGGGKDGGSGAGGVTYYRLYGEGRIRDYVEGGGALRPVPSRFGLDFNRNYPANWAHETRQRGAGPFPFSEPEIRAVGELFMRHRNITGAMSYHTTGGVLLRPFCTQSDDKMPGRDLAVYKVLGERGEEIIGYPCWQVYEKFTYDRVRAEVGSFPEWVYEHLGIPAFEIELWDMNGRAGLPKRDTRQAREVPEKVREQEAAKLLAWNDRELAGQGFIDWHPFHHPQLGEVEIGGWEPKFVRQNPPGRFLPEECHKCCVFTLKHAAASPLLRLKDVRATLVGAGAITTAGAGVGAGAGANAGTGATQLYKITAILENRGYLPTNLTDMAVNIKAARPVVAELAPASGVKLVFGEARTETGHLEGRSTAAGFGGYGLAGKLSEKRLEWLVQAPQGYRGRLAGLTVTSEKAGRVRADVAAATGE